MGGEDHLFQYSHFTDEENESLKEGCNLLKIIELMRTYPLGESLFQAVGREAASQR